MFLSAAAFAAWRWLRRGKLLTLTPCAAALRQLEEARRLMDPEHAREYCFAASHIIRNYIEAQLHVHAPRLTTEEFLRDLVEVRETMLASHRELLGDFLQHCDMAKFAGWRYSMPALEDMHITAVNFVQQTVTDREPSSARSTEQGQSLRGGDGSRSFAVTASPPPNGASPAPLTSASASSQVARPLGALHTPAAP